MKKFSGFAQALRKAMTDTSTNANALAVKAKLGAASVFAYARGRGRPTPTMLASITEVFPPEHARALVAAHLRDETPEAMRAQLRIGWICTEGGTPKTTDGEPDEEGSGYVVNETSAGADTKRARARVVGEGDGASAEDLERLLGWMRERAERVPSFRQWLWKTYDLMQ